MKKIVYKFYFLSYIYFIGVHIVDFDITPDLNIKEKQTNLR